LPASFATYLPQCGRNIHRKKRYEDAFGPESPESEREGDEPETIAEFHGSSIAKLGRGIK
jgi:hypothetical protein